MDRGSCFRIYADEKSVNSTYMHTENYTGFVQYGSVPTTYWTSQWTFEPAN